MVTGFTQLFSSLLSLVGILFLVVIAVFLIGSIKALIETMILQSKTKKVFKQLNRIQKKANESLRDFQRGASLLGIAKAGELDEEVKELERLSKELTK